MSIELPGREAIRAALKEEYPEPSQATAARVLNRARQASPSRRLGRGSAVAFAAALLVSFGAVGLHFAIISPLQPIGQRLQPPAPAFDEHLAQTSFATPTEGWAIVVPVAHKPGPDRQILESTTDGGRHWTTVLDNLARDRFITDIHLDSNGHGIVVMASRSNLAPSEVGYTTDRGQHWSFHKISTPVLPASVQFTSAEEGWALSTSGDGSGYVSHTSNGGATWTISGRFPANTLPIHFVAHRPLGPIYFASPQSGLFLSYDQPVSGTRPMPARLFATSDGGTSWTEVHLIAPQLEPGEPGITSLSVELVGGESELMVASEAQFSSPGTSDLPASGAFVYATSDAGRTWSAPKRLPTIHATAPAGVFAVRDVLDPVHWWVATGGMISTTSDAGATWSTPKQVLPSGQRFERISFTDPRHGWATGVVGDHPDTCDLYVTSDGGNNWARVSARAAIRGGDHG